MQFAMVFLFVAYYRRGGVILLFFWPLAGDTVPGGSDFTAGTYVSRQEPPPPYIDSFGGRFFVSIKRGDRLVLEHVGFRRLFVSCVLCVCVCVWCVSLRGCSLISRLFHCLMRLRRRPFLGIRFLRMRRLPSVVVCGSAAENEGHEVFLGCLKDSGEGIYGPLRARRAPLSLLTKSSMILQAACMPDGIQYLMR